MNITKHLKLKGKGKVIKVIKDFIKGLYHKTGVINNREEKEISDQIFSEKKSYFQKLINYY